MKVCKTILLMMLFLSPGLAWATPTAQVITPPAIAGIPAAPTSGGGNLIYYSLAPYDLSYTLLKDVFGPVVSTVANGSFFTISRTQGTNGPQSSGITGTGGSLLGSFFGVYNEAMLLVVAVLTLWHGVTGIAMSADSGEWLGKNTSGFWAPVRVTLATGMLLPVFGGYSLVQGVIFWAILQGSGVADQASNAAVTYLAAHPVVGNPTTPQGSALAANVLANETCAYYLNNRVYPLTRQYTPSASTPGNKWGVLFARSVVQPSSDYSLTRSVDWYAPTGAPVHFSTYNVNPSVIGGVEAAGSAHTNFQNLATTVVDAWAINPGFNNPVTRASGALARPVCGSVTVHIPLTNGGQGGLLGEVGNYNTLMGVRNQMARAQIGAINTLEKSLEPLAQAFASTHMPVGVSNGQVLTARSSVKATAAQQSQDVNELPVYAKAIGTYDSTMAAAGSAAWQKLEGQGNTQQIQAQIASQGWVSLGDIFWVIAQNDEAIRQMINFTAHGTGPKVKPGIVPSGYGAYGRLPQILAQVKSFTGLTNTRFHAALSKIAAGSYTSAAGRRADLYRAAGETAAGAGSDLYQGVSHGLESAGGLALGTVIGRLTSRIVTGSYFQDGNANGLAKIGNMGVTLGSGNGKQLNANDIAPQATEDMTTGNPMFELQQMGRRMTSVGAGMLALGIGAKLGGGLGKLAFLGGPELGMLKVVIAKGARLVAPVFELLTLAFLAGGFFLGVYVPMLPLLIWITGVLAWLIMVAETMLAAPPWVVGHASLEGEGWAPRNSSTGYQMIAGLLLRPVLMVGGLLIGMLVMSAGDWLLGIMSQSYLTDVFGNGGITGAIFSLGMLVMVGGMLVFIAQTSLSLITKVPDSVLKWIGGGQSPLGATAAADHSSVVMAAVSNRSELMAQKVAGATKPPAESGGRGGSQASASSPSSSGSSGSKPSESSKS